MATSNFSEEVTGNLSVAFASYPELRAVKLTVYLLICFFSVTGNTLVVLSVVFFKRLKTVPNIFIANLAACDLVTTLSSIPFDLPSEELGYWPYGAVMCKILWPLATFSSTSAAFTLVSISGDRYGALVHPLNFKYKITKRKCAVVMCCVYLFAALAVSPYLAFLRVFPPDGPEAQPQCGEDWPSLQLRKSYTVFLFTIQYGIPLLIMSYIYIRLGYLLHNNTKKAQVMTLEKNLLQPPNRKVTQFSKTNNLRQSQCPLQRRKEQNEKTVKMFFVIVMIFLVFMMPNQILWLIYDFGNSQELFDHIDLVAFICRAFTYTNSVLNALVYGACNRTFRRAFQAISRCKCGRSHQRELSRTSMHQGRLLSEANSSRTRSPPLVRGSPKRRRTAGRCSSKPHSLDSIVDGSFNSESSSKSTDKKYARLITNDNVDSKLMTSDEEVSRENEENLDNAKKCNRKSKEESVNMEKNIPMINNFETKV